MLIILFWLFLYSHLMYTIVPIHLTQIVTSGTHVNHSGNTTLINPRRACAARVTAVCVSVKSHLTSEASVRPENAVTYSAGNECQKIVGFSLKPLRCRDQHSLR